MKVRESGMPEQETWESFFEPGEILSRLGVDAATGNVADFGCGYGTFALAAALRIRGEVFAFDIDPHMLKTASARAGNVDNIRFVLRDFVAEGTGLPAAAVDYAMIFNLLHLEDPVSLLKEARRILKPGGKLGVIHWNYDPDTPRGPPMSMRPTPEQCRGWAEQAGFVWDTGAGVIDLPPHHYGLVFDRP